MQGTQRADHIYNRAYALAVHGLRPDEVVTALSREGFPEAASMLDTKSIRADLRQLSGRSQSSDIIAMMWRLDGHGWARTGRPTRGCRQA